MIVERAIFEQQVVSSLKFIAACFIYYYLTPRVVIPKELYEKLDDKWDKVLFNLVVMTGFSALVFPYFVLLKMFGFMFLVMFFALLKLCFVKCYHRKSISLYIINLYREFIYRSIRFSEKWKTYFRYMTRRFNRALYRFVSVIDLKTLATIVVLAVVFVVSFFPILYRGFISYVEATPDISQFYYWFNILKKNVLIDRTAGAPYMWGDPMIIHTINIFTNLDPLSLLNIAPVFYTAVMYFGVFLTVRYLTKRLSGLEGVKTDAPLFGMLVFAFIMTYTYGAYFLGKDFITSSPHILHFKFFRVYFSNNTTFTNNDYLNIFYSFWRITTFLCEEHAFAFLIVTLYLFIKTLETKRDIYLFLYGISAAITLSIHAAAGVTILFTFLPVFIYALLKGSVNLRFFLKGSLVLFAAVFLGSVWMVQFFIYGLPDFIGKAAPFLDVLLHTKNPHATIKTTDIYSVVLFVPTKAVLGLLVLSVIFLVAGIFKPKRFAYLGYCGAITIGVLLMFFFPNFGLPQLADKKRINDVLALVWALDLSVLFFTLFEIPVAYLFSKLKKDIYQFLSHTAILVAAFFMIMCAPSHSYVFSRYFYDSIYDIEHKEFPYLVSEIRRNFQPFTYTIVAKVQQFPQVVSKGYHINIYNFLLKYKPTDKYLKIPTDYIFIFDENIPKKFMGMNEMWYRWRIDLEMALKSWIAQYAATHKNIKVWFKDRGVTVYLIDNRKYMKLKREEQIKKEGVKAIVGER